jgi:hypothetical protein
MKTVLANSTRFQPCAADIGRGKSSLPSRGRRHTTFALYKRLLPVLKNTSCAVEHTHILSSPHFHSHTHLHPFYTNSLQPHTLTSFLCKFTTATHLLILVARAQAHQQHSRAHSHPFFTTFPQPHTLTSFLCKSTTATHL